MIVIVSQLPEQDSDVVLAVMRAAFITAVLKLHINCYFFFSFLIDLFIYSFVHFFM